jgi:hypothetical protein
MTTENKTKLPDMCVAPHPDGSCFIAIKNGEMGLKMLRQAAGGSGRT